MLCSHWKRGVNRAYPTVVWLIGTDQKSLWKREAASSRPCFSCNSPMFLHRTCFLRGDGYLDSTLTRKPAIISRFGDLAHYTLRTDGSTHTSDRPRFGSKFRAPAPALPLTPTHPVLLSPSHSAPSLRHHKHNTWPRLRKKRESAVCVRRPMPSSSELSSRAAVL